MAISAPVDHPSDALCSATSDIVGLLQSYGSSAQDLADILRLLSTTAAAACVSPSQHDAIVHAVTINIKVAQTAFHEFATL